MPVQPGPPLPATDLVSAGGVAPSPADTMLMALAQRLMGPPAAPNLTQTLGSAMAGFGAGLQGQPNPVAAQQLQSRQLEQQGLRDQLAVAGVLRDVEKDRRARVSLELDILRAIPDTSAATRTMKVRGIESLMRRVSPGSEMPNVGQGLIYGDLTPQRAEAVGTDIIRGTAPDLLLKLHPDVDPSYIVEMQRSFQRDPDLFAGSLGKKSPTQIRADAARQERLDFQAMLDSDYPELKSPEHRGTLGTIHRELNAGKHYWEGTAESQRAARLENLRRLTDQRIKEAALRMDALLPAMVDKFVQTHLAGQRLEDRRPGSGKGEFFSRAYPYKPYPDATSREEGLAGAAAGLATRLEEKGDRQLMQWVAQTKRALDVYRDAVVALPTVYPVGTGNTVADNLAVAQGVVTRKFLEHTDPRMAPIRGIVRHLPSIARISGLGARMSNFVTEMEQRAAGFDSTNTRQVQIALSNQVESFINDQLMSLGFAPLPPYRPGRFEKNTKTGEVRYVDPDGRVVPIEKFGLGEYQ